MDGNHHINIFGMIFLSNVLLAGPNYIGIFEVEVKWKNPLLRNPKALEFSGMSVIIYMKQFEIKSFSI